jgi:Ca2+:H+ antiporter
MELFEKLDLNWFFIALLVFIPLSIGLAFFTDAHVLIFITAILALIPLAKLLGVATNNIALQTNPTMSGLVSATFGNLIELIIALLALHEGLIRVVQASIIGSIIGNILLLVGLSLFAGGLKFKHQQFNREVVGVSSTMLIIAVVGLTIPSVYSSLLNKPAAVPLLSDAVAVVLALTYLAGLYFTIRTHKDMFDANDEIRAQHEKPTMTKKEALIFLFLTTIVVALVSESLVGSLQVAGQSLGMTETFIGIVLIAIITNIAEKSTAITFAMQNKINVSLEIGMSSAIQVALFVVPILVFVSQVMGWGFTLAFSMFEVTAVLLAVLIMNQLAADGRCNWLEGVQLVSVYCIIAIAFYFI